MNKNLLIIIICIFIIAGLLLILDLKKMDTFEQEGLEYTGVYNEQSEGNTPSIQPAPDEKEKVSTKPAQPSKETTPTESVNTEIVNILFLGIDRTEERDASIGIFRSDTIMIARINPIDKALKILSIPRDTYTYLPVIDKKDKINHAYAYGSLKGKAAISTIDAIHLFTQKPEIENYFSLEMEPIPDMIDDIVGVELDVELDIKTHGADVSAGKQILDGEKAFDYINWRYSDSGDIGRIERQQKFVKALFKKTSTLENSISSLLNLLLKYQDYYETNLSIEQIHNMITVCSDIDDESIQFYTIPGEDEVIDQIWYWVPDTEEMEKILSDFYE